MRYGRVPASLGIGFSDSAGSESLKAIVAISLVVASFLRDWKNADIADASQRLLMNLQVGRGDEAFEQWMRLVRLA